MAGPLALVRRSRGPTRIPRAAWYREQWTRAAAETGWDVHRRAGEFLTLVRGDEIRTVAGPDVGLELRVTYLYAGSAVAGDALAAAGVPVPPATAHRVTRPDRALARIRRHPGRFVVKPAAGSGGGAGVTVGPPDARLGLRAIADASVWGPRFVLQEVVDGPVVRVLVHDGRVLDVVRRDPAEVVGDGRATVQELVDRENARRSALGALATGFVPTGADCRSALARAGMSLRSRPIAGERVVVAGRSNTGSEQQSVRIEPTPELAELAARAAGALGVRWAGVDVVLDDERRPRAVLEVNTGPGLHWHLLVRGEPYDPFVAALTDAP